MMVRIEKSLYDGPNMLKPTSKHPKTQLSVHLTAILKSGGTLFVATLLVLGQVVLLVPSAHAEALRPITQVSRPERPGNYEVPLPTPRSHYDEFGPGATGLPLLVSL